jgi:hypothetical protein
VSTTQTIRPMGDITVTNVTGVSDNTNLYNNIDESVLSTADYEEFISGAVYNCSLTSLTDPGVDTGFSVLSVFGLGTGTTSATFAVALKQSTTTIETWNVTVTADPQTDTHALSSVNVANIVFTSGAATNLRLQWTLSSVS